MKHWQPKDLQFLMDDKYFPNCIECSEHWLDSEHKTFFHKKDCQHGRKAEDWDIINERLDKRLEAFEKKYGVNGSGIFCNICGKSAVGTMHVFFHGTDKTAEDWPVCMNHAYHEDRNGRETQFRGFPS